MKKLLIYDSGGYTTLLPALVKKFDVFYHCVQDTSYPRSNVAQVGRGLEGVNYVKEFWNEVPNADLIAFFDCRFGDIQQYLRNEGHKVWGSGKGNELENYRYESNEILGEVGLPKVNMEKVVGIDNLRKFLKENENIYVKSNFRGDGETWKSINYKLSEPQLDVLESELGLLKNEYEFVCCHAIDGDDIVEVGSDSFFIDDKFPDTLLYGYEVKDLGYLGVVKKTESVSKIITEPLKKLAPVFGEYKYRGFFSDEIRVGKDEKPYLTDFTARCPSPCSELYFNMITNIDEVMWEGSQGNLVQPKYSAKYGAQAIITSGWAEKHWQALYYPKEIRDHVKIKNHTVINETDYYIPINDVEMCQIGSVVATGDTAQEAIKNVKKYADQVEGYCVNVNVVSEKANKYIEGGRKLGILF